MREALRDPEVVYRRRWLTLLVLCISLIVITLDNTILNVAIPTLAHSTSEGGLGASASQLQWIVDAYTLVFAGLLLTAGQPRRPLRPLPVPRLRPGGVRHRSALSAFGVVGDDAHRHPRAHGHRRCVHHAVDAVDHHERLHRPHERGKAIGVWAGVSALGIGLGPITGGVLLEHFWWGSVFIVNVPIVIVGLVLGYFLVPESRDPSHGAARPGRRAAVDRGARLHPVGVIEAPAHGWGSPVIIACFAIGGVLLAGVLRVGAALEPSDARHALLREPAVQRRERRDRARVPRHCSARCSCSRSTCSRCSATPPWRPARCCCRRPRRS